MASAAVRLRPNGPELVERGRDVWYATGPLNTLGEPEIAFLKARAAESDRRRSRICMHASPSALVHEMLIAHHHTCYVRPHRHPEKAESLFVVEGRARAVFYGERGNVESVLELGESRQHTFAYRVGAGRYHSLLIESDWLIFLEVSEGPFSSASSVFPDWAPDGNDPVAARDFESRVASEAARILEG